LIHRLLLSQASPCEHFRKFEISCVKRLAYRLLLATTVFPPSLELSGRIETEQQNDQNEDDRSHAHGFFGQRKHAAEATRRSRLFAALIASVRLISPQLAQNASPNAAGSRYAARVTPATAPLRSHPDCKRVAR
jgi:hypothetical protein